MTHTKDSMAQKMYGKSYEDCCWLQQIHVDEALEEEKCKQKKTK